MSERAESRVEEHKEEELVTKKGGSSVIWNWFGFKISDIDQQTVLCRLCRRVVLAKGGNTSNLFSHLKNMHVCEYEEFTKMRATDIPGGRTRPKTSTYLTQQSLKSSFAASSSYDKTSQRWKDITSAITHHIAKDMLPIQTVEKEGFRKLIKTLDPRYELPSRKYFSQTCLPQLYTECREKVYNEISKVAFFSTTADLWSSRTTEPYISLTIHYVDSDWKLQSKCLQTSYFPDDHTGEIIASALRDALLCWGLKEARQVCMTTDSGTNMIKALQLNKWTNLGCFGHRLHNAIERSVQNENRISRATGVCKKIVSTFSYSWKKQKALMSAQTERGLPTHKLITESPTRWGSRLQMIDRVLEQEKAITQVLAADKKTRHLVLTWQDIMVLESVIAALKPLQDFTDALSGEAYVSVSYLKPVIRLLNTEVLNPKEGDTELTQGIKSKVLDYLNEKYTDPATDELLTMATFLDPRFKTMYMSTEKLEDIKVRAALETESLLVENTALVESSLAEDQPEREREAATAPPPSAKKPKKSLGSFFKKTCSASASCSEKQIIEQEINSYVLAMAPDSETDPLEWWRLHESNFPRVSCLAKKYLCIPATSSPSERAFSTGGNVVTCSRAALKPEMVNRLVFLAQNL